METLTKIKVKRFKSLKDFEIPLKQFNVLIGPNGSGKTNVLELIKFVNLCVSPQKTPAYPFADWGGYRNIVWRGDESETIHSQISYVVDGRNVIYDFTVTGSNNGRLGILEERIQIEDYLDVALDVNKVGYHFKPPIIKEVNSVGEKTRLRRILERDSIDLEKGFTVPHNDSDVSILNATKWHERMGKTAIFLLRAGMFDGDELKVYSFPSPPIKNNRIARSLYALAASYLVDPRNIILLRQLNYDYLRKSTPVNYSDELDEDGDGLVNLLFKWFNEKRKLPDIFTLALEALFPNWQISFQITQEGNIIMEVNVGTMTLAPTSIPDGFYKLLAILAAIELKPRIILIDEIETSLHARIIEYVVDLLKNTESTVIVTSHSPLVVDYVDIGDLVLLETNKEESTCRKVENPGELRKELQSKGITASESWLYGEL